MSSFLGSLDVRNSGVHLMRSQGNSFLLRITFSENVEKAFCLTQSVLELFFSLCSVCPVDQFIELICDNETTRWHIRFWNCNGTVAKACGNGTRCAAHLLYRLGYCGAKMTFHGPVGLLNTSIEMGMPFCDEGDKKVQNLFQDVSVHQGKGRGISLKFAEKNFSKKEWEYFKQNDSYIGGVDVGNFHLIIIGKEDPFLYVRFYHEQFKKNLSTYRENFFNISYVRYKTSGNADISTWERGVGPTLACGSAACAALVALRKIYPISQVRLYFPGGPISVFYCEKKGYEHKASSVYERCVCGGGVVR
ncbi:diaminopimelate epimerase [Holospora undulata HU1]|uniref:diaminopimelate epimerase n=2 Tax=Holospora TaxID=44747 RepID=A0A061JII4_9PROT|nr:diaminopimelate epimerase [Holospora undulata HU1]